MSNIVTLSNGARARVLPNGQYRFVSGADPDYLAAIRPTGVRGPNKRPSGRAPGKAYLTRKLKQDHEFNMKSVMSDFSRSNKKVLNPENPRHARIIRKAGSLKKYDVRGFDDGTNKAPTGRYAMRATKPATRVIRKYTVAPRSAAQTRASKANIQKARNARGRGALAQAGQLGGYWW